MGPSGQSGICSQNSLSISLILDLQPTWFPNLEPLILDPFLVYLNLEPPLVDPLLWILDPEANFTQEARQRQKGRVSVRKKVDVPPV